MISSRERVFDYYEDHNNYRIVHDNLSDMTQVTSGQTYQKGAWILHMLRNLIGDEIFQEAIRNYYSRYMNSNATTDDFKHEMEVVSGLDLDIFFNQWLYQGGHIILDGSWKYDDKKNEITE